ncbi:CrcB protein [hydrothermal vent metagenome]|uniref:CrcB protein n=1 Tax=hydrothermal vent metagenome TaxID=652676 RepID=A0A1W1CKD6_9ZZZZ
MNLGVLLAVGTGGFLGAVLRLLVSTWVHKLTTSGFPYGTLSVNILGSFLMGFLFMYFSNINLSIHQKLIFTTGLLGALTTFSTFSMETVLLLKEEEYINAVLNIFLNVSLSLGATFIGILLFRFTFK